MDRNARISLTAAMILLLLSASVAQTESSASKPKPADYSFTVTAERLWMDTGLDLEAGDRVHIYGTVLACEGSTRQEKAHLPVPSAPGGALLAKLHGEAKPIVATPDADLPVVDLSHLYLGINGWHCHGSLKARVHVEWHKRAD